MEDLHPPAQRLGKRLRAHRHHHELLEVDVVVGVRAAVEDVHHRQSGSSVGVLRRPDSGTAAISKVGCRPGRCHRNRQNSVRAQTSFVLGAVERNHHLVERALVGGIHVRQGVGDLAIHILYCLAARPCPGSGPCRHRAVPPPHARRLRRRWVRWRGPATHPGNINDDVLNRLKYIIDDLKDNGAQAIIAGCTELGLVLTEDKINELIIDPITLLAKKAIEIGSIDYQHLKLKQ